MEKINKKFKYKFKRLFSFSIALMISLALISPTVCFAGIEYGELTYAPKLNTAITQMNGLNDGRGITFIKKYMSYLSYRTLVIQLSNHQSGSAFSKEDVLYYRSKLDNYTAELLSSYSKVIFGIHVDVTMPTDTEKKYKYATAGQPSTVKDSHLYDEIRIKLFGTNTDTQLAKITQTDVDIVMTRALSTVMTESSGNSPAQIGYSVSIIESAMASYSDTIDFLNTFNGPTSLPQFNLGGFNDKLVVFGEGGILTPETTDINKLLTDFKYDEQNELSAFLTGNKVSSVYMSIFSASATYLPGVSTVGNEDFIRVLKDVNPEIVKAFNKVSGMRRPLLQVNSTNYKNIFSNPEYKPTTSQVTLKSLLNNINDASIAAYVVDTRPLEEVKATVPAVAVPTPVETETPLVPLVPDAKVAPVTPPVIAESNKSLSVLLGTAGVTPSKNTLSQPILTTGFWKSGMNMVSDLDYATFNLTQMILYNSTRGQSFSTDELDSQVYLDFFGNIVLSNDVVLLPGVNNYTLYAHDTTSKQNELPVDSRAFLSTYPKLSNSAVVTSKLVAGDGEKYVIMSGTNTQSITLAKRIGQGEEKADEPPGILSSLKASVSKPSFLSTFWNSSKISIGLGNTYFIRRYVSKMKDRGSDKANRDIFLSGTAIDTDGKTGITVKFLGMSTSTNDIAGLVGSLGEKYSLSKVGDISNVGLNKILYQEFYNALTTTAGASSGLSNGLIPNTYLQLNVLLPVVNGSADLEVLNKNAISVDKDSSDLNRVTKIIASLVAGIYDKVKNVDNVLGIQASIDNPILKNLMIYGLVASFIIVFIFFFYFTFMFARGKIAFPSMIVVVGTLSLLVLGGVNVIPKYVPSLYNTVASNFSTDLAMNTVLYFAEQSYKDANFYDISSTRTASDSKMNFTLFKLNAQQSKGLDVKESLTNVNPVYRYGDEYRIAFRDLWNSVKIEGKYIENVTYTLKDTRTVSSSVDYYCPYYQIVHGLTTTLNSYSKVYLPDRNVLRYKDTTKDAFMLNNFVRSPLFIDYNKTDMSSDEDSQIRANFGKDIKYPLVDFLGLDALIIKDYSALSNGKQAVWIKEALALRTDDQAAYRRMISDVNYKTKAFILTYENIWKNVSDENYIKLVALYATMEFNMGVSDMNHFVYPTAINYGDIPLDSLLHALLPTKSELFALNNLDIVYYCANKLDLAGVLLFAMYFILQFVNSVVIQFLFPTLYLLMLIALVTKIGKQEKVSPALWGFVKFSVILVVAYSLNVVVAYSVWGIESLLAKLCIEIAFNYILLKVLISICVAVYTNMSDLGTYSFKSILTQTFHGDKMKSVINKLKVKRTTEYKHPQFTDSLKDKDKFNRNKLLGLDDYEGEDNYDYRD